QGLQEDVELGGLRILRIGTGVNLRGIGVSLAPDLLHLAVGVGLDFVEVALALTCNAGGLTLTLGTKALCDLESLADHALVDPVEDIGVVVYSLDPEIEYGDSEPRQFLRMWSNAVGSRSGAARILRGCLKSPANSKFTESAIGFTPAVRKLEWPHTQRLDDARFNPFWGPVADDGKTFSHVIRRNRTNEHSALGKNLNQTFGL